MSDYELAQKLFEEARQLREKLAAAETRLAEADALIGELHDFVNDPANWEDDVRWQRDYCMALAERARRWREAKP